jgi:subtilisin family serine protease
MVSLPRLLAVSAIATLALPLSLSSPAAAASTDPACTGMATSAGKRLAEVGGREGTYRATRSPSDPLFASQWALNRPAAGAGGIDAPGAWDLSTGNRSVTVAVVDTGADLSSQALQPNLATNAGESGQGRETNGIDDDGNGYVDDWRGWDFSAGDNQPQDRNGHGTHVAGIIGARGNDARDVTGVAWDISLLPLQVLAADGSGRSTDIADAMTYAAQRGARVVNLSLGGPGQSDSMLRAICAAPEVLFVAAAGNTSADLDSTPFYPCAYPPANVVCVAASDQQDRLAGFSSYGAASVDLAAPGAQILGVGLNNQTAVYSGTSMAAPQVSGVAALVLSQHPDWTAAQVKEALLNSSEPLAQLTGRVATAARLNAARALNYGRVPAPAPTLPAPAVAPAPAPQPPTATPAPKAKPAPPTGKAERAPRTLKPRSVRRLPRFLRIAVRVPAAGAVTITITRTEPGQRSTIARTAIQIRRPGLKIFRVPVAAKHTRTLRSATHPRLTVTVRLLQNRR